MRITYEEASGTENTASATTIPAGSYGQHPLNTVGTNTIPGASLAANQITLPAGTYEIHAGAEKSGASVARLAIYDVTAGAFVAKGVNNGPSAAAGGPGVHVRCFAVLTVASVLELRVRQGLAASGTTPLSIGTLLGYGDNEVIAEVTVHRLG